jgi:aspartate-semialdehyde dehydrogenase
MPSSDGKKVRVAVVGATGVAGQEFLGALRNHPWFEVTHLAASARSAGKSYRDAISSDAGQVSWYGGGSLPAQFAEMTVTNAESLDATQVDLVFTAIDAGPAKALEAKYAEHTPVISTASAYRYEDDVPLLLPGINGSHAELLKRQSETRGWKGFVSPNPNCTTVGLAITLAPLYEAFGIESVHMVSMQAVSGAGRSPGVIALDVVDNIIPHIPKEEEKVAAETLKVLGTIKGTEVESASFGISATCTRVAVLEGHTEAVHVKLGRAASAEEIQAAWESQGKEFLAAGYPSAPEALIEVSSDSFRPQVRLDRDAGDGMTTVVGRLRPDPNVENGWKFMLVSHNTKMGAAKGCVLMAEHLHSQGMIAAGG